jgi:hypothetical protein
VIALETWDGRVAGFEVKAGSRVQDTDLSGLRLLRDRLGERFIAGFLLNLGELAYRKEETNMVIGCRRASGTGGIGYYYISDTYIALFSKFIPVGVWEAVSPNLAATRSAGP